MRKTIKTCCISGHRPKGFPWNYYDDTFECQIEYRAALKNTIERYLKKGYKLFICGGAMGVDLDFAEDILKFREIYPDIQLELAIPYPKQCSAYSDDDKLRYTKILSKADTVTVLCNNYSHGCMHQRNRYMVDKSELVICVWNTENRGGTYNTLRYAEKKKKQLEIIALPAFLNETKKTEALLCRARSNGLN